MFASIIHRPGIQYPPATEFFSPSEPYPEYRLGHVAKAPNPVYAMVREVLAQAGLDQDHFGTSDWNPLRSFIRSGANVFLLCNFVQHRRRTESDRDFLGKCTHGSVLRPLLDYVLLAVGDEGKVNFGNAPLQSCDFDRVLRETGASAALDFFAQRRLPVHAKDLRLLVTERGLSGRTTRTTIRDQAEAITVSLDDQSLLRELCNHNGHDPQFRVADYDPEFMRSWHDRQRHRYLIHRAILDADVILSVPKLKTHEKVGITCGLKGYVGIVGRKECLPHHRFGDPKHGGDEYPVGNSLHHVSSRLGDFAYRAGHSSTQQALAQTADHTLRRILRKVGCVTSGAWSGNDTTWRMALDLARIAHFANRSGSMKHALQRTNLIFVDGIIGGQGEGPLAPTAAEAGCLLFSDSIALGDRLACRLMGFDPNSIPLVREAAEALTPPGNQNGSPEATIFENSRTIGATELAPALGRPFAPPLGWRNQLKANA